MAVVTTHLGAQRPRRLVAGRWRRWSARGRVALSAAPLLALGCIVGLSAVVHSPAVLPLALGCLLVPPAWLQSRRRMLYWRARWSWDARAGGLVHVAERGIEGDHDNMPDGALEVAPTLCRVYVHPHGRSYIIRPLPGQTVADLEQSIPALVVRWRAAGVAVRPASRQGWYVIDVVPGDAVAEPVAVPEDVLPWRS